MTSVRCLGHHALDESGLLACRPMFILKTLIKSIVFRLAFSVVGLAVIIFLVAR